MRLAIATAVAATLLLSACPAMTTGAKVPKKATGVAATPAAQTTGSPATPAPTALPTALTLLSGNLKMDAHYVVAAGGGNVISAGGGNVIAAGGGNVISAGGGNVISAGGGNVVAAGGGNLRVLAVADVPVGTVLPAKGMVVVPVSLMTGKPVGEPVFTDERGHYEVAIPKDLAENVRLVAAVPGKSATDPLVTDRRLQYAVVTAPTASQNVTIDEDSALITRYLRVVVRHRIRTMIQAAVWADDSMLALYPPAFRKLRDKSLALKITELPELRQITIYERFTDLIMASIKLGDIQNDSNSGLALPMMAELLRDLREAATTKLAQSSTYFDEQPYIINQSGEGCRYEIKKPADLGDFLVFKHLYRTDLAGLNATGRVFENVGLGANRKGELGSAAGGIQTAIMAGLQNATLTDALGAVLDDALTLPLVPEEGDCK